MTADATRQLAQQAAHIIKTLPDATRDSLIGAMEREDATPGSVIASVANPTTVEEVRRLLSLAAFVEESTRFRQVALMLRAAHQLDELHRDGESVDIVWTGPSAPQSALFRSEQTLLDLIRNAQRSLLIVTYLAYKVAEVRDALLDALNRGVRVMLVIEPERSDGGGASVDTVEELRAHGDERTEVYAWPVDKRPTNSDGGRGILHVKCAVADDDVLLVSSAKGASSASGKGQVKAHTLREVIRCLERFDSRLALDGRRVSRELLREERWRKLLREVALLKDGSRWVRHRLRLCGTHDDAVQLLTGATERAARPTRERGCVEERRV